MQLIKGRKTRRGATKDEEKFRVPAIEESWEISCGAREEWDERAPGNKKADPGAGFYDIAS